MAGWSGGIYRTMNSRFPMSKSDTFQYVEDDPLDGNVTVTTYSQMYEGEPTHVLYNITLEVQGGTPMNLNIESIELIFTPLDIENRTEANLPRVVGLVDFWTLHIENTTFVNIVGTTTITPVIIEGDVFLGCRVDYVLRNDSSSGFCEFGNNCWFGPDGSEFMIPVSVVPLILRPEGWWNGLEGLLLIWCLVILYEIRKRWLGRH